MWESTRTVGGLTPTRADAFFQRFGYSTCRRFHFVPSCGGDQTQPDTSGANSQRTGHCCSPSPRGGNSTLKTGVELARRKRHKARPSCGEDVESAPNRSLFGLPERNRSEIFVTIFTLNRREENSLCSDLEFAKFHAFSVRSAFNRSEKYFAAEYHCLKNADRIASLHNQEILVSILAIYSDRDNMISEV